MSRPRGMTSLDGNVWTVEFRVIAKDAREAAEQAAHYLGNNEPSAEPVDFNVFRRPGASPRPAEYAEVP